LAPGQQPALCKGLTNKSYLQNCRTEGEGQNREGKGWGIGIFFWNCYFMFKEKCNQESEIRWGKIKHSEQKCKNKAKSNTARAKAEVTTLNEKERNFESLPEESRFVGHT
jgi:hypothetical protein